MHYRESFNALLTGPAPILALAPMQDVTDLPFMQLMSGYGGPDVYYTEYFRVHATSTLEPWIVDRGRHHEKHHWSVHHEINSLSPD